MQNKEIEQILDFILDDRSCLINAYIKALDILEEECKDEWTTSDVIDAIKRALKTNLQ